MRAVIPSSLLSQLRCVQGVRLWARAPLAPFTTIGTGGKAGLLLTVSDVESLSAALGLIEEAEIPWLCLGAGSNLLVADEGCLAVVVKLDECFHYVEGLPSGAGGRSGGLTGPRDGAGQTDACQPVTVTVGGGAYLARLAAVVAENGLSGLEFACGIPGSVGGGVAMNAGAHGGSLAGVVEAAEVVSSEGRRWVPAEDLEWGYRFCRLPPRSVVTAVRLGLTSGDADAILEHHRSLLRTRRLSQPRGVRTFGSVFKNPPGDSAGRLLEGAGVKGLRRGGAEVSTVHANFLVNLGDATTADILTLMGLMREAVERSSGIALEPEVKLLGADFPWVAAGRTSSRPIPRDG